mgnify:CR=1 FL=1
MKKTARFIRPEIALIIVWGLELIFLAWMPPFLEALAAWLMILYLLLNIPFIRGENIILCLLIVISIALITAYSGNWAAIYKGFQDATIFMGFFGSIILLRAAAQQRPEIQLTRNLFKKLKAEQTNAAFLVGAHLIGSVLVVGVMAILAPILKSNVDPVSRRRVAEVCQRGMCLAPLWSPFWVASAFATQKIPGVSAWQIMGTGLVLAGLGLVVAHLMFSGSVRLGDLRRALLGFMPILPPVIICGLLIVSFSAGLGFSSLEALIATVPLITVIALVSSKTSSVKKVIRDTWRGSKTISNEIIIVTMALILGRVLEAGIGNAGIADSLSGLKLPGWFVIACVIGIITTASLVGIHQLVSIIVVLIIVIPMETGVSAIVLLQATLVGWAFASMVGITAVSTATASNMFAVPRSKLAFGPNLLFVAVFGSMAVICLFTANVFLFT